ncbi:MAG TPA: Gfo/Idh/MocA family oxidoreductase [Gemmataceae bacterium]|nr:Gfo/Idh/MocA family oxidoreductase [Gemmataceae bacterium]
MAIDLTPEQRKIGQENFQRAVGQLGLTRRDFMKGLLAAGAAVPIGAAAYYGYSLDKLAGKPVKAGLIGAGDEGGVLVGEHNPKYLEFVAYCDIRPSNQKRIFEDEKARNPNSLRRGFKFHYGSDCAKRIKFYEDYRKLLEDPDIEAVVIALPLHLHAPVAIDAMKAGKHVLCEKLMAWNIEQCKDMIRVAAETDRVLSIGHQRHYSMLYAHAVEVLRAGVLGDIKHIRALWHRNNTWPQLDKNGKEIPGSIRDSWRPEIKEEDRKALEGRIRQLGYKSIEELVRWRLYRRTGGGLMAELGSHQLDACSIFLTALARKNYPGAGEDFKLMPLAVSGVGGKYFYKDDREVEDHVFVTFEFPGPNYYADETMSQVKDKDDIVVVTYSSINTNQFEPYGECLMGTRASMVVEMEQNVMLYPERGGRSMAVTVSTSGGQPALDSAGSGPAAVQAQDIGQAALRGPVSRGYREEMEHFAYCVRMWDQGASRSDRPRPRCHGQVAMADAIIALTANQAMKKQQRIAFRKEWFDPASPEVPDPDMKPEYITA